MYGSMPVRRLVRFLAVLMLVFAGLTAQPAFAAAPANDDIDDAYDLGGPSSAAPSPQIIGSNVGATLQAGEFSHGANTVWFQFTAHENISATIDLSGSNFDTYLGIVDGLHLPTSQTSYVAANDDISGINHQSRVTFNAVSGHTYLIQVSGYQANTGNIAMTWTFPYSHPANDDQAHATALPFASAGSVTEPTWGATGTATHYYDDVWWTWLAPASGRLIIDTNGSDFYTNLKVYDGATVVGEDLESSGSGKGSRLALTVAAFHQYTFQVGGNWYDPGGTVVLRWKQPTCRGKVVTVDIGAGQQPTTGDDVIMGTADDDVIFGGEGNDTICAGYGDDAVYGSYGSDWMDAGPGNDLLKGGFGNEDDTMIGGDGNDTVQAEFLDATIDLGKSTAQDTGSGFDTVSGVENLEGDDGDDTLIGTSASNRISGGQGRDTLIGKGGNDVLSGGSGSDTVSYASAPSKETVKLASNKATGGDGTDTLSSIESVIGSKYDDTLYGNSTNNRLNGGSGKDTLLGGAGTDILIGGSGVDTASYAGTAAVTVDLAKTDAQNTIGAGYDTLSGIESLLGGSGADKLYGNASANVLSGGSGNDRLDGRTGTDTANGGIGTDVCRAETRIACEK